MENASLGKRLLAIFYDVLIVFFIWLILSFIIQQIIIQLELTTLKQAQISAEETILEIPSDSNIAVALQVFLAATNFFYFGYYWTKRGQTLGMKVWKVKAVTQEGGLMSWGHAIKRYAFALLGLGLVWILIDKERLALQDKLSGTRLIKAD